MIYSILNNGFSVTADINGSIHGITLSLCSTELLNETLNQGMFTHVASSTIRFAKWPAHQLGC